MKNLFINQLKQLSAGIISYPLSIISAFILAVIIIYLEENSAEKGALVEFLEKHAFAFGLFYLSSWGVHFYQRRCDSNHWWWGLAVAMGGFLLFDSWYIHISELNYPNVIPATFLLYGTFTLAATLLWATQGIERSDRSILQILFAGIISGVFTQIINLGVFLAFAGVAMLFDLDLPDSIFFRTAVIAFFPLFASIFAGNLVQLQQEKDAFEVNKRSIQLFNYILLPLTLLYLFITLGYIVKTIIQGNFGSEVSHWLSAGYVGIGILTYQFGNTLQPETNEWWTPRLKRWFIISEGVVLLSLLISVSNNVWNYGFTMQRLMVLLFGLWLLISFYWFLRNPMTFRKWLILMSALAFIGSIGWFSIDELPVRSQINRLESYIGSAESREELMVLLEDEEIAREVNSITDYLVSNHSRPERFLPLYQINMSDLDKEKSNFKGYLMNLTLGEAIIDESKAWKEPKNTSVFLNPNTIEGAIGIKSHLLRDVDVDRKRSKVQEFKVERDDAYAGKMIITEKLKRIQYILEDGSILLDEPFGTAILSKALSAKNDRDNNKSTSVAHEFRNLDISIWLNMNWVDLEKNKITGLNTQIWIQFHQ